MVQHPGLGFPTLEAQAQHLAGAARPCQPHSMEEKEEKKKKNKQTKITRNLKKEHIELQNKW